MHLPSKSKKHILKGVITPESSAATFRQSHEQHAPQFGWVNKGFPLPDKMGFYVVEYKDGQDLKILAYIDRFGRAFSMDEATEVPPACYPNLLVEYDRDEDGQEDAASDDMRFGTIYLCSSEGERLEVSRFVRIKKPSGLRYSFVGAGYDFGKHGSLLTYKDFMARAYLAYAHGFSAREPRNKLKSANKGAIPRIPIGISDVIRMLRSMPFLDALRTIMDDIRFMRESPIMELSGLLECLNDWLVEAGASDLLREDIPADSLRLAKTVSYADTFYISIENRDAFSDGSAEGIEQKVSEALIWKIEAALNLFLLTNEELGSLAPAAHKDECQLMAHYITKGCFSAEPNFNLSAKAPHGKRNGEWEARVRMCAAIEHVKAPIRLDALGNTCMKAGVCAIGLRCPTEQMMPKVDVTPSEYAKAEGLFLAKVAFGASHGIREVTITAYPAPKAFEQSDELNDQPMESIYQLKLSREAFEKLLRDAAEVAYDPERFFKGAEALSGMKLTYGETVSAYESVESLPEYKESESMDPFNTSELSALAQEKLAAATRQDLSIVYDAKIFSVAEKLVEALSSADSTSDAVHRILAEQDKLKLEHPAFANSARVQESFTRLLASITEGKLALTDSEAISGTFIGKNECLERYWEAQSLIKKEDQAQALDVLVRAVADTTVENGFIDTDRAVYRNFASYTGRVLYNLGMRGSLEGIARARIDAGKEVRLVPDSLFMCLMEITDLLGSTFEHAEEALHYCQKILELAPTSILGYSRFGRIYMLMGDMENAAKLLIEGLKVVFIPEDIAMLYYQLAYTEWKMGKMELGMACYAKSISISSVMAAPASAELNSMAAESGLDLPSLREVDETLKREGVPLAPNTQMMDALLEAAVAAIDEGLLPVGGSLLSICNSFIHDDALTCVLRSLR